MTKAEYLKLLSTDLSCMPYGEVQDIIDEIGSHFDTAIERGKTEDQIAVELGDVHELAKSYINITPNKLPAVLRENSEKKPAPKGARVFVILFNVFVGAPIGLWWAAIDIALVYAFVSNLIFFIARWTMISDLGVYITPAIMFQISSFFGLLVILVLAYFGIRLLIKALSSYLRWNRKLWVKGF